MKTVLVTGANRGIGLALASHCAGRGDRVIAVCRTGSAALDALGARIESGIELTDAATVEILRRRLADEFIDRLVLNAGVLSDEPLTGLDEDGIERIRHQFEVNAVAPLRLAAALLDRLAPRARIGIVTSRMGSISDNNSGGRYGYRMSKAAVNAAGKSLAVDLAPRGIIVALLHPGFVRTDMVGGRGNVSPEHAAAGLMDRLEEASASDSGGFWHANGARLPW